MEEFYASNSHFILAFIPDLPLLTPGFSGQGSGLSHQAPAAVCAWQAPDLRAPGHPSARIQQRLFAWSFSRGQDSRYFFSSTRRKKKNLILILNTNKQGICIQCRCHQRPARPQGHARPQAASYGPSAFLSFCSARPFVDNSLLRVQLCINTHACLTCFHHHRKKAVYKKRGPRFKSLRENYSLKWLSDQFDRGTKTASATSRRPAEPRFIFPAPRRMLKQQSVQPSLCLCPSCCERLLCNKGLCEGLTGHYPPQCHVPAFSLSTGQWNTAVKCMDLNPCLDERLA